jgi:hypothetical protein
MNLTLFNRDVLAQIPGVLNELDQLTARINLVFGAEHDPQTGAHAEISVTGLVFDGATQTTVGAAGGASALPATPTGYWTVTIGSREFVTPYYAKS